MRCLSGSYDSNLSSHGSCEEGFPSEIPGPVLAFHSVLLREEGNQPAWREYGDPRTTRGSSVQVRLHILHQYTARVESADVEPQVGRACCKATCGFFITQRVRASNPQRKFKGHLYSFPCRLSTCCVAQTGVGCRGRRPLGDAPPDWSSTGKPSMAAGLNPVIQFSLHQQ